MTARSTSTRTEVVSYRVSTEEKQRLVTSARASGMSFQDYGRAQLLANTTPTVLSTTAYANTVLNTLSGLEGAIQQAKAALAAPPEGGPHGQDQEEA